jgi:methylamine dehydrogenase accessory protein MauD
MKVANTKEVFAQERRSPMTGLWLASYITLWLLFLVLSIIVFGLLQQIGLLRQQLVQGRSEFLKNVVPAHPTPENDGPDLGSYSPELIANEVINGNNPLSLPILSNNGDTTLLIFMSPLCESCQYIVEPLNRLADKRIYGVNIVVIMRADKLACQAFLSVFPLQVPVICDTEHAITMKFQVHHAPFGLLYDAQSILLRKSVVKKYNDIISMFAMNQILPINNSLNSSIDV